MSRFWTNEEIDFLKANYGYMSVEEIGKVLDRTPKAVNIYCCKHNIKSPIRWSEEDTAFLRENYGRISIEELEKKLNRSAYAIKKHVQKEGIRSARYWTKEETAYLENTFGRIDYDDVAKKLGRSPKSIRTKVHRERLGLFREQSDFITVSEASRIMGCDPSNIRYWAKKKLIKKIKRGIYTMIKIDELYRFMQEYPEKWSFSKCDYELLELEPWFRKMLQEEREKKYGSKNQNRVYVRNA